VGTKSADKNEDVEIALSGDNCKALFSARPAVGGIIPDGLRLRVGDGRTLSAASNIASASLWDVSFEPLETMDVTLVRVDNTSVVLCSVPELVAAA